MQRENDSAIKYLNDYSAACKKIGGNSDKTLFKMIMAYYGAAVIPVISIADGGRERGQFYGFLRKIGVNIPESVLRDRSHVSGEIKGIIQQELSRGIREGQNLTFDTFVVKLKTHMSIENYQKFRQRIKNFVELDKPVKEFIKERFKK